MKQYVLLLTVLLCFCLLTPTAAFLQKSLNIPSSGAIEYLLVTVRVDFDNQIGINNLTLGFQMPRYSFVPYNAIVREKAQRLNSEMIRIFTGLGKDKFDPCTHWNESTHKGTYNWTLFDEMIETILNLGAEPLVCIGGRGMLPDGMTVDSDTNLPSKEDFGQYCEDIVRHCNVEKEWGIRFWEIYNEFPYWENPTENTANYTELFNYCQERMHAIDPTVLCATTRSNFKVVFDYFLEHAQGVGFLSFHKYDSRRTTEYDPPPDPDNVIMERASELDNLLGEHPVYAPSQMRKKWQNARGEDLPIVCSETNVNYVWQGGTDPRIQQMFGATWYAEELRAFILDGVDYSLYYDFDGWVQPEKQQTGGLGFSMVMQQEPHTQWLNYLTNLLLGENLAAGDTLYESASSDPARVSCLAWSHDGNLKLLLIGKTTEQVTVHLVGVATPLKEETIEKDDDMTGGIRESTVNFTTLTLNGYSVKLLTGG